VADLRTLQPSFTSGELSPALHARVDLAKFATGLKTAKNLFIHPHGGVSNRPGLQFIREVKDSTKFTKLIPFQFNTEQSYVIEAGEEYFRFFRDGGVILDGGSPYEVVTDYTTSALRNLVYIQEADVMYVVHVNYAPSKLERLADDNWPFAALTFLPTISAPTNVGGSAVFIRRAADSGGVTYKVTALTAGGAESAMSSGVTVNVYSNPDDGRVSRISWNASAGAASYNIYRDDGAGSDGLLTSTTATTVDIPSDGRQGDGSLPGAADPGAPPTPTGVSGFVRNGRTYRYKISAIDDDSGEESLPTAAYTMVNDLLFAGNKNMLTWDAVAGASAYIIYRQDNGQYGYVGRSETADFTDENITPDIADGPQIAENPFNGPNNRPRCVTFVDQRLAFGSTNNDPQAVWLSQSANYENFSYARPRKASDAFSFRIRARQVNEIRALLPMKGLMVLTSGSENLVTGGPDEYLNPTNQVVKPQSFRGCAEVQPIVVGETTLFAQERGGVIRDFSYEFANDGFVGKDLTILSRHLFEGRSIRAWAYAQAPNSIVWVVLDDGSLVSLTYMKEHDVWGWTRHETEGTFEDVTVIGEGQEDVPYFIVRRLVDGVQRRYIERLHTRVFAGVEDAFFVDSGLTYDGAPATAITGLDHLEGCDVVALVDGNVVRGLTVSSGSVTLPNAGSVVHVGLPYEAVLETLPLDIGAAAGLGSIQGRMVGVSQVTLKVEDTRGIWLGHADLPRDSDKIVEWKQRQSEAWNEAIRMATGNVQITPMWDWTDGGGMCIKQFDPLPMTILSIAPDITIGR